LLENLLQSGLSDSRALDALPPMSRAELGISRATGKCWLG
jgi:hypothetical protein